MRFSIIIPLYNKARYVAKAIDSVLSQTFPDYELVIMDDGSQDDSFNVATQAIEGEGQCHIHRQQNAGVSIARNSAVSLSHGDYLCFLDADDWWDPTFLEHMSGLINDYPEAGIYGTNYTIVNETKQKTRVAPVAVGDNFKRGYINYCEVYAKNLVMPLWTGAVCVPRRVYDEMKGFPEGIRLGEDFLLWIRVAMKYKVAFLNKPQSFYNQDSESQWRAVTHLQEPTAHMLWNLGFLEQEEKSNSGLKQLLDNLRVRGLFPYYLSDQYRESAKLELAKIDWTKQPKKVAALYRKPVFLLKVRHLFFSFGSLVKQWAIKLLK